MKVKFKRRPPPVFKGGEIVAPKNLFTTSKPALPGGKDHLQHDLELLAMERALFFPNHSVNRFLMDIKNYSQAQAAHLIEAKPAPDWEQTKEKVMDAVTGTLVKRHTDLIAEVNDQHIKASKLAMARAVEMLTKLQVSATTLFETDDSGNPKLDKAGKPIVKRSLRSIDLLNCANTIKTAQEIYRKAMGLANHEGIAEILDRVGPGIQNAQNIQNNINIHVPQKKTPLEEALSNMTYEDVMKLIDAKREQAIITEAKEITDAAADEEQD